MSEANALEALIQAFKKLPGVGPKSASRMAYHMLQHDRAGAQSLSHALSVALQEIGHCEQCHTLSSTPVCATCEDSRRDRTRLCVVETPTDQQAIERTLAYKGHYFVLMGAMSPLEGLGPQDFGVQALLERVSDGLVQEVILATNFTPEGEATAHVLGQALLKRGLNVTRLARGVPLGSELEFVDLGTIAHALFDRKSTA